MAIHQLLLPKMGESVSEATVVKWLKQPGDRVEEDEAILEIATDKVDSDVPSPVAGVLKSIAAQEDQVVQVGEVLALIETESAEAAVEAPVELAEAIPGIALTQRQEELAAPVLKSAGGRFYSPLIRSIASAEGLSASELDQIPASGADDRLTKQDVLDYLANKAKGSAPKAAVAQQAPTEIKTCPHPGIQTPEASSESSSSHKVSSSSKANTGIALHPGDEIVEMDRMRKLIADHMVHSVHVAPHVCSFVEADVTNLVNWRNQIRGAYEKREGEKITFTPVFIEAVSKALKDFPMVNVSVDGTQIIKRKNINIGMATALPTGNLIVPVIKNADQLSLVGLSKSVNDLAQRARANKLKPDDTQGGTFTLTNIGAFGNIMGTPIINQPQVAILAVGVITKKPAVIETPQGDLIGIRHKMYLSLSYDHRVVDGALGGQFVRRVADYLENWDMNREI
jgi:2-oxoglutarate dehydrogenase E2 component (dihydrolipoamide succinyltransferase)